MINNDKKINANLIILKDILKIIECLDCKDRIKWRKIFDEEVKKFSYKYDINENKIREYCLNDIENHEKFIKESETLKNKYVEEKKVDNMEDFIKGLVIAVNENLISKKLGLFYINSFLCKKCNIHIDDYTLDKLNKEK